MSHDSNTELLDRASQLIDDTSGMSFIPTRIEQLIKENDLDKLRGFVCDVESMLAQEHFNNADLLPEREIY